MSSLRPRAAAAASRVTRSRSGSRGAGSRPASPGRDEGAKRTATASRLTDLSRASATAGAAGAAGVDAAPAAVYPPPPALADGAYVPSLAEYKRLHAESLADPAKFWGKIAAEFHWHKAWDPAFTRCVVDRLDGWPAFGGGGRGVDGVQAARPRGSMLPAPQTPAA
jgi:hypothetical protein